MSVTINQHTQISWHNQRLLQHCFQS